MHILVAGSTGKTGRRLIDQLRSKGHSPIALVRESSNTASLCDDISLRYGDLTNLQDDVCDGCDAVIFAAGAGGSSGHEMTDKVDRDGAKKLIDLAVRAEVKRFIMLSSVGADDPDPDSELFHYLKAKHDADEHLKKSGLSYAILRPVSLTDEEGTGDIRLGNDVDPKGKAARDDVAAVLADAVDDDQWRNKTRLMQSVYR